MYFKGTITQIGDVRKVTNATTQVTTTFRNIVLQNQEKYISRDGVSKVRENDFVFELKGDMAENFSLEPGTEVTLAYSSSVRQSGAMFYETKYVFSIRNA